MVSVGCIGIAIGFMVGSVAGSVIGLIGFSFAAFFFFIVQPPLFTMPERGWPGLRSRADWGC